MRLDAGTARIGGLSDAELIDATVAFERVTAWAQAQARVLAEFAARRPPDSAQAAQSEQPSLTSRFAADEIGLALRLARGTAVDRILQSVHLTTHLPATLPMWGRGELDASKVRMLCDATAVLDVDACAAVEQRVLSRAAAQTRSQLRACTRRAVMAADGDAANKRHRAARRDRRVVLNPDVDGMATLSAMMPASDAVASYEWLSRLARSLGENDPRGMDARRADLVIDLLTGRVRFTNQITAGPAVSMTGAGSMIDNAVGDPAGGTSAGRTAGGGAGDGPGIYFGGRLDRVPTAPARAAGRPSVQVVTAHSTLTGSVPFTRKGWALPARPPPAGRRGPCVRAVGRRRPWPRGRCSGPPGWRAGRRRTPA